MQTGEYEWQNMGAQGVLEEMAREYELYRVVHFNNPGVIYISKDLEQTLKNYASKEGNFQAEIGLEGLKFRGVRVFVKSKWPEKTIRAY